MQKFSAQSDGSDNIFSAVICCQGVEIMLNDNNRVYLHEYPVTYTKVTAKVVVPSNFGYHIKST